MFLTIKLYAHTEFFEIELTICIKMDWYAIKSNQPTILYLHNNSDSDRICK